MFRKMRRFKQQISEAECREILAREGRAALSVNGDDGYPYAVPINFYFDESDNRIYFHGASQGHKADAMGVDDRVCLTTWNEGTRREGHWEYDVTSVVVFGRVRIVEDREVLLDRLRKLAEKYYPSAGEVDVEMMSPAVKRVCLYAIDIDHMTGKLVNEK